MYTPTVKGVSGSQFLLCLADDSVSFVINSEVVLGKAIKQLNLPREEIVVLTKVGDAALQDFLEACIIVP